MIVDSSAIIAILRQESDAQAYAEALRDATDPRIPAPVLLEASLVAGAPNQDALDELIAAAGIEVLDFDALQAATARAAHLAYGRRSGSPARLNFGDCMVYAAAKVRDEPLLFKGDDFRHTDVTPALPPG